ncbi:MAG: recombinase family protein, partial [Halieaceae bacterium]|nr:recombinase family protein [Halieaceae bacterium]
MPKSERLGWVLRKVNSYPHNVLWSAKGRKRPVEIHPENDQNPQRQFDALTSAGGTRVLVEKAFGAQCERPELQAALDYTRAGDTLVVWKLDRLARSTKQLIE